jgi:hypothetical protein
MCSASALITSFVILSVNGVTMCGMISEMILSAAWSSKMKATPGVLL